MEHYTCAKSVQLFHCVEKITFVPDDVVVDHLRTDNLYLRAENWPFLLQLCICSKWRGRHLPRISFPLMLYRRQSFTWAEFHTIHWKGTPLANCNKFSGLTLHFIPFTLTPLSSRATRPTIPWRLRNPLFPFSEQDRVKEEIVDEPSCAGFQSNGGRSMQPFFTVWQNAVQEAWRSNKFSHCDIGI